MGKRPNQSHADERDALRQRIAQLEADNARLRRAEAELRAAAARLEDFAEASGGWFWETDAELRFSYMSQSVQTVTGVPPEWHYGKTRADIGIPESVEPATWAAHLETLALRRPFRAFEFKRTGPDGERWMHTGGRPAFDDAGAFVGYRGVALDVSTRIEAERRLARLVTAIEVLNEPFSLWDESDRLIVCNQEFRQINAPAAHASRPGTRFVDHLAAGLALGLYPAARGREQAWLQARLEQHRQPRGRFEMERQDGRWLLVHEQRLPDGATVTIGADITARKRAELALQEKAAILETSFRTIPDGILVLDRELRPVAWNQRLFAVLAVDGDLERAVATLHQDLRRALVRAEAGSGDGPPLSAVLVPSQTERQLADGSWVEIRVRPIDGGGCVAVYRDIAERKRMQRELELRATTDRLTGALNRGHFFDLARAGLARARRHCQQVALLVLDIDGFKAINDTHGHAVGDTALRHVARICQDHLREGDVFGRVGGEEFAVFLPMTDAAGGARAAEKLRALIEGSQLPARERTLKLTASFGVAEWSSRRETIEELADRADALLYEAKRSGRNRVCGARGAADA